ncbi:MAG: serine--tRNA ligase [Gemmataceae bacterium]|nr:serine--tRNA ligase [Gemmataceae bacterium]
MLDIAEIRRNPDAIKANVAARNSRADVDGILKLDEVRRRLVSESQVKQQRRNEVSALTPKEKDAAKRAELVAEGKALKVEIEGLEKARKEAEARLDALMMQLPNLTHPDAPKGGTEADSKVLRKVGEPRTLSFKPLDHVALCEKHDLCDFEAGTSVAGQKFYFLKNEAVLLELALIQYAMGKLVARGWTPVITPDLAKVEVLEGIGFQPRDNAETRQVYLVQDTDLCLVGTAEITLGGMHRGQVFDAAQLPRKYVGLSHCFRTEAGAAGRDTRGLYRVHQFTKVEMFAFCLPEQSEAIHLEILAIEEEIFQGLGLPYQVLDTAEGDLGGPAYRKYDLEAWMPCRGEAGQYGEVTSTSNCTDFQARRLDIRYRKPGEKRNPFVHTLNGTAVACTRALVAILENGQQEDGSIVVPEALRPWVGKDRIAR